MSGTASESLTHVHHIVPKHRGGNDDASNLIRVQISQCDKTTQCHAMWHFCEWQLHGLKEDYIAWKALAGFFDKEEIIGELIKNGREKYKELLNISEEAKEKHRAKILEGLKRKEEGNPSWRKEHGEKVKASGAVEKSLATRREKEIGMFSKEWQSEMARRGGESNSKNKTGFCQPEVQNCPIRKARGGRAGCLSRQGIKLNGEKHYSESFEYRTHLSSNFIDYYVHFGLKKSSDLL